VLNSDERRRFNEIASRLLADDPDLGRRHQQPLRHRPRRPVLAVLLWMSMPFIIGAGGWTGLLIAVVAGGYAAHLWFRGRTPVKNPTT
jgi:Protein of unknown function (DUF3040)